MRQKILSISQDSPFAAETKHAALAPISINKKIPNRNYNPKSCMILNLCKTEKSSSTSETTQKNEKQETQNKNKEGERETEATFLSCCKSLIVVYLIFCPQFEDLMLLLLLLLLPGHSYSTTTS
jgi:hypothetical protein